MRYRLRTLMIFVAISPPLLAGGYFIAPRVIRAARESARTRQPRALKIDVRFKQAVDQSAREYLRRATSEAEAKISADSGLNPTPEASKRNVP